MMMILLLVILITVLLLLYYLTSKWCWQLIGHASEGDGDLCEHLILIVHLQREEVPPEEEGDELWSHTSSHSG